MRSQKEEFIFAGGQLWLDFVNTRPIRRGQPRNLIGGFSDFIAWLIAAQVLSAEQAERISRQWNDQPEADRTLQRALELREVLRKMAEYLAQGKAAPKSTVETINEILRQQIGYTEIRSKKNGFEKEYHAHFAEPDHLLYPIAESAADVLCYADPSFVKKCESERCVLFFYDSSKNHSRRWCSMAACGNREKVAAHYQRRRAAKRN